MKNMANKKISNLILLLTVVAVFSGCAQKPATKPTQNIDDSVQAEIATTTDNQQQEAVNMKELEINNSDIDTSDWQTYRNEVYGFEVKFPASLSARDWSEYARDWVLYLNIGKNEKINDGAVNFGIFRNVNKFDKDKILLPIPRDDLIVENVYIGEDNIPAFKVTVNFLSVDSSVNSEIYYFEYSNRLYQISYDKNKTNKLDFNDFDKILKSIKLK